MLWIVKDDDTVYLFKGKVTIGRDEEDDIDILNTNGCYAESEFDFCTDIFENVTGLRLPNLKPKKLLLMVK